MTTISEPLPEFPGGNLFLKIAEWLVAQGARGDAVVVVNDELLPRIQWGASKHYRDTCGAIVVENTEADPKWANHMEVSRYTLPDHIGVLFVVDAGEAGNPVIFFSTQ